MSPQIDTFEEFWPHYVHAHRHPLNRALHYVGTTAAIGTVVTATVTFNPAWLLLTPIVGYGPSWITSLRQRAELVSPDARRAPLTIGR